MIMYNRYLHAYNFNIMIIHHCSLDLFPAGYECLENWIRFKEECPHKINLGVYGNWSIFLEYVLFLHYWLTLLLYKLHWCTIILRLFIRKV